MIWSCKDFLQILVLLRWISRALTELWKSMFENLQFFDWKIVTSKARSAAVKHFLITNKVLGSISTIIALRWYKNYSCVRCRSGGNQIFTKFPGHDPRFDGWAGFQISTLYLKMGENFLERDLMLFHWSLVLFGSYIPWNFEFWFLKMTTFFFEVKILKKIDFPKIAQNHINMCIIDQKRV